MVCFRLPPWESLLLLLVATTKALAQDAATCDVNNDTCQFQADGACDAGTYCDEGTDCFDCDPCQAFKLDCDACVSNGCFYCPSEGLCSSFQVGADFWSTISEMTGTQKVSTCNAESAWGTTCEANPDSFYTDPLYGVNQWIYDILNVEPVWQQGITGGGVMVRVNDPDGVDVAHPELSANWVEEASCEYHELRPILNPLEPPVHGTAVASLVVGGANNGECAAGIAPDASLSTCTGPGGLYDDGAPTDFFLDGVATTDVSVNSWGFDACSALPQETATARNGGGRRSLQGTCPFVSESPANPCVKCPAEGVELNSPMCETYIGQYCQGNAETEYFPCMEYLDKFLDCYYNVLSEPGQEALQKGVAEGRDGKGIVYMFAAGNEHHLWEDVNFEGWLNTRFTNVVAAVGKDGLHASYSTPGAAVLVSGPGGDKESLTNNLVAYPASIELGGGCADATIGTSFATPSVSGVVALMLQANPDLGWRDVQGIIASTARKTDPENPSWTTNGATLHHSNLYGFGIMDATAAVEAAKTWVNYGPEKQIAVDSGAVNLPIADVASATTTSTVTVDEATQVTVENAVVYLQLDYESRGDLEVILTSPSGTQSLLHPGKRPENGHPSTEERWKLLTVRNYGESANGDWTLTVTDTRAGKPSDCVDYPFQTTFSNDFFLWPGNSLELGCNSLFKFSFCNDTFLPPEMEELRDETNGMNAAEACCVCGGGGAPISTANALVSWKLMIYGHENRIFDAEGVGETEGSGATEEGNDTAETTSSNDETGGDNGETESSAVAGFQSKVVIARFAMLVLAAAALGTEL